MNENVYKLPCGFDVHVDGEKYFLIDSRPNQPLVLRFDTLRALSYFMADMSDVVVQEMQKNGIDGKGKGPRVLE